MMFGTNPGMKETCKLIKKGSIGAELGVWKGDSTELLLQRAAHVHMVDSWSPIPYEASAEHGDFDAYLKRYSKLVGSEYPSDFQTYYNKVYEHVLNRFEGKPVTIYRMTTQTWFIWIHHNKIGVPLQFDWIYIDASHDYKTCLADLYNSHKLIISGGRIYGDDYGNPRLRVTESVDRFAQEQELKVVNFHSDQYYIEV